ncbi:MAG TPA: MarR family transcriptional regulator [Candidatus Dormibacteraeota bacterium]|nr:MarR family transcriptional regulator [Candidatus Dormibacteraeota bacterium]
MTTAPTLTGQDIGQAEKATRAVLDTLLARTATTFHRWVALNLTATGGGRVERGAVVRRMAFALKIEQAAASAAVDELVELGLAAASGDQIVLTPAGTARFEEIRDGIAVITERLYGGLPVEDLVTAHRVLAVVTERANAELARLGATRPSGRP